MKTYKNLYPQICTFENLYVAYRQARCGKRDRAAVASFEFDLERNLLQLQDELQAHAYAPGGYTNFYIHEPKRRLVSAAPFRDRVVHHALCHVIEPIWEARFIGTSYACRVGKGTHRALDQCHAWVRRYRYALQGDIVKYFPSIDHQILKGLLAKHIADRESLWLIEGLLASGEGIQADEHPPIYFPGDDLFAALRPRGLPIGNLTSQFWANCYLNPLDHFVKREMRCAAYVRYADDFLLFADDKQALWSWREAVVDRFADLRLTIHPGSQPRPVTEGMPFLGFVVFPTHRRLKRRKVIHFRRKIQGQVRAYRAGKLPADRVTASVVGWTNHARYGDTLGLRRANTEEPCRLW
jgi:RNA-directed DNA polymerase